MRYLDFQHLPSEGVESTVKHNQSVSGNVLEIHNKQSKAALS